MNNNKQEFSVIFKGEGLKYLNNIAKDYGITKQKIISKALRLLKIIKISGNDQAILKERNNQELIINIKKL